MGSNFYFNSICLVILFQHFISKNDAQIVKFGATTSQLWGALEVMSVYSSNLEGGWG
jgi:hypothetical protein